MQKTKAIFSLLDTPAFGGAEQYMFSQLLFLNRQGYSIVLATNNETVKNIMLSRLTAKEKKTFFIINAPYRLDAIGNWKGLVKFFFALPRAFLWCYKTLRELRGKYDNVVCLWAGFSDRLVFSPLAHFFHCPLIWIEIGPLEPTFKHNFGFPRFLFHFSEKYPNHIITTSLFTKKSILRNARFSDKDITLVYPGTKLFTQAEIKQYRTKSKAWRQKEKLTTTILIGLVARLADENEVDMVINAFSYYLQKKAHKNCVLLIIGDGPMKVKLENLVHTLQRDSHVRFTGFITEEEKCVLLSSCEFFIFPRAWELDGFGMTTIEAMALGLPVLTTDFGPQIEIVTNGKEGYRYKPHDSIDLAFSIAKMISLDPEKRRAMSKNALERARIFSEIRSNEKMFSVIQRSIY